MANIWFRQEENYVLLLDEEVVTPLLTKELVKGAKGLIQQGFSAQLIKKVFLTVVDLITEKINELAISMEDFDMKKELITYFATQINKKLFGCSQKHIANIIVDAVHATGYDYEGIGPFDPCLSDFENGFNLIEIIEVSGGSMDDSFFVEGIAFNSTTSCVVDGFEMVENPKILLFNMKPGRKSKEKDKRDDESIIDILDNYAKDCTSIVVLSRQAIDADTKKELAERGIYFADLVAENDLVRIADATCDEMISSQSNYFSRIDIGTCKLFQLQKFGNEMFGIFSGCLRDKAATVVVRGNDKFIKQAGIYLRGLIACVRTVMKDYRLVAGGCALYDHLRRFVLQEANNVQTDSKPIIKAVAKAIQTLSEKNR